MSHPFSSTFDALQAHFTQKPDKPNSQLGSTNPTSTQTREPSSSAISLPVGSHAQPGKAVATQAGVDGVDECPEGTPIQSHLPPGVGPGQDNRFLARAAMLSLQTTSRPSPTTAPEAFQLRSDIPRSSYISIQPKPYPDFQFQTRTPLPTIRQSPGPSFSRESGNQAIPSWPSAGMPSNTPPGATNTAFVTTPTPSQPIGAPLSIGAPSQPQTMSTRIDNPPVGTTSQEMAEDMEEEMAEETAEDETEAMDITDSLLERQNALNVENPLPKLPPKRGFSKKYFMAENKPGQSSQRSRKAPSTKKRGPRKAVEPTGDIKYRLNMASNAWLGGRLDEAIEYVQDAIRINAETFQAWTLLASFLQEKGDKKGGLTAKVFAATLQPKEIGGWLQCADLSIELRDQYPDEADDFLQQAIYYYSSALRVDSNHRLARHGRAALSFEMGRIKSAAKDYAFLVERCHTDVYALRGLAEMSVLLADTGKAPFADRPRAAIEAYRRCIAILREDGLDSRYPFDWKDIRALVELLAYVERFQDAIHELRSLSRFLLTRADEEFWDSENDDREWDVDNTRRINVEGYQDGRYPHSSYGSGLPLDLRTKLAVCRLKLGHEDEAMRHLEFIDPDHVDLAEMLDNHPDLLLEGASALYEANRLPMAQRYYEPLRSADLLETEPLVRLGRCYLNAGDQEQAEECFTAAIDQDESNSEACIDARYELAKMYEAAREEREAYILVNEAIRLQEARDQARERDDLEDNDDDQEEDDDAANARAPGPKRDIGTKQKRAKGPPKPRAEKPKKERKPKAQQARRRPKVFARNEERQREEDKRSRELAEAWQVVRNYRESSEAAEKDEFTAFISAGQKLVNDFRSYKDFYPWDKYLAHLGLDQAREKVNARKGNPNLLAMVERLSHNINPEDPSTERQTKQVPVSYRGVPFDEWLLLFLEYAISLAQVGKFEQAYKVCESARDASIFAKSKEDLFLIHVTWAACALRGRDEETCVAVARWFMREYQYDTDPFRMFSALARLCPSPASWYASGPVQKYMLRQIKLMDRAIGERAAEDSGDEEDAPSGRVYQGKELDITLLMLYGHILFISNSFTYALNYFMRAYSLDPQNSMVILTVGHCYVHYALKRQSENRQYLLTQGFLFLHQYYDIKIASPDAAQRQEAHYNLARSYHAIGLPHLAADYYRRVLQDVPDDSANGIMGRNDLTQEAAYNLQQFCWAGGDMQAVKAVAEKHLVL